MTERLYKSGFDRDQFNLLPPRVEDYVGEDNPVRAISAFVSALDLKALGFQHVESGDGRGQPSYNPGDLLKLYLYGYLNQVRSSRRLALEAARNLEVIWLLGGLRPGYRTIAKFRRDNSAALVAANRTFVILLRRLDLLGGDLIAIDGAFFDGNAGKESVLTSGKLRRQLASVEADIADHARACAEADRVDDARTAKPHCDDNNDNTGGGDDRPGERMAALMAQRARLLRDRQTLEASDDTQLSRTDPDARLLSKSGQRCVGYNVQIAVDAKHKLIVASDVVTDGNDLGQLHAMALKAKTALGSKAPRPLKVLADGGYYSGAELIACEASGIEAYVPVPKRTTRLAKQGRFTHEDFEYDTETDRYLCAAGEYLKPHTGRKQMLGVSYTRYVSTKRICGACELSDKCLSPKGKRREMLRRENQDVIERHKARMETSGKVMKTRSALVEHPFGTLKCRAGYRHFLVRKLTHVRGEWSLMALCYNFTRLLNIFGLKRFKAIMAVA